MKPRTIDLKRSFFISFFSTLVLCIVAFILFIVYKKIQFTVNDKQYQQCLSEQTEADKIALSYIPKINQVLTAGNDSFPKSIHSVLIEGVLTNQNVEKLEFVSWSGNDGNLIKTFKHNNDGSFSYEVKTQSESDQGSLNPNFNLEIIPKDTSIICVSKSDLAKTDVCTLSGLTLEVDPTDGSWCLGGLMDIGLGSAPVFALSDSELESIGLSKDNICNQRESNWRNKCINKNFSNELF